MTPLHYAVINGAFALSVPPNMRWCTCFETENSWARRRAFAPDSSWIVRCARDAQHTRANEQHTKVKHCTADHKTIANILMQNGADPRIETEIGLTAADYARANATPESRKLAQSCEDFAVTLVKIEVRSHFACILRMPPPPSLSCACARIQRLS